MVIFNIRNVSFILVLMETPIKVVRSLRKVLISYLLLYSFLRFLIEVN